jgi:hypothetical protein
VAAGGFGGDGGGGGGAAAELASIRKVAPQKVQWTWVGNAWSTCSDR